MKTVGKAALNDDLEDIPAVVANARHDPSPIDSLIAYNESYIIYDQATGESVMLTDFDCILIHIYSERLDRDPDSQSSLLHLVGLTLDLKLMVGWTGQSSSPGSADGFLFFRLIKTPDNERARSNYSQRSSIEQFNICSGDDDDDLQVAKEAGEFGFKWALMEKGDMLAFPTPREVINGLETYYYVYISEDLSCYSNHRKRTIKEQYGLVFEKIMELVNFENPDEPLEFSDDMEN